MASTHAGMLPAERWIDPGPHDAGYLCVILLPPAVPHYTPPIPLPHVASFAARPFTSTDRSIALSSVHPPPERHLALCIIRFRDPCVCGHVHRLAVVLYVLFPASIDGSREQFVAVTHNNCHCKFRPDGRAGHNAKDVDGYI
jgi:hypothetical protein